MSETVENLSVDQEETQGKEQKTFSAEYVRALRSESRTHRLAAKTNEQALRKLLGIMDTEELGNVNSRIAAFEQTQQQRETDLLAKANKKLIGAEIKALAGYDTALLAELIDCSQITVDDNGSITGLDEAVQKVAERFPAVKKPSAEPFSLGASLENMSVSKSVNQQMNEAIRASIR